ncbi:pilus assembly FimT family protein [Halanaerobium praevalens]|uniref:Prepilin-type N-terminal cleavage/methylation domain-containing protein n=1 Tax=Halanaerobium praevalens (strain ATCC 33744 / DSM 2228 / GSL) TaxID=572479 RepID=E3DR95_HALPG|nr:prepilin-type N-terminal cleavage/methylation domain-containing protein [Halanaerobium praevalens]ADO77001.1 hypothetical protein Hprae_0847 [Halanaerobium praevalens DSM 2228]
MNKNNCFFYNKGITIIEILITVMILGVVFSVASPMIIQTFNIFDKSSIRITQNRLADLMLEDISTHFKSAMSYNEKKINGLNIYEFEAYSPQSGNQKTYKIIETANSELEFRENGNLIRRIENVEKFKINNDNPPIYFLELKINKENGEKLEKQISLYARNITSED